ncbi:MAG: hypothetical protein IK025_07445 [Bacteroidales bacterium]|nr:hypothetical protein [Bacteroidales bacterium]
MQRLIIVFIVVAAILASCKSNPLDVNVSDIDVNVPVERFDQEFYACSNNVSFSTIGKLADKYPIFFDLYNLRVISCGSYSDQSYYECLRVFFSDYSVVEAYDAVNKEFANCDDVQKTLNNGFRHMLYYYPDEKLPRVVTFVAGFNQSIVLMDDYVGIGLEKYLGTDCKLYDMLQIPEFAKREMQRNRIPIDVMSEWFRDKHPYKPETENLVNTMIYNGMLLYFLEAMFPDMAETDRLMYTDEELRYCHHFERDMWTSMIENGYLFSTDLFTIRKFTENAPFTSPFGQECPARVANWTGLQIVKAYVKNNEVSLTGLLEETDYQKILNLSEYNPK